MDVTWRRYESSPESCSVICFKGMKVAARKCRLASNQVAFESDNWITSDKTKTFIDRVRYESEILRSDKRINQRV